MKNTDLPLLEARGVTISYSGNAAVKDVSLAIYEVRVVTCIEWADRTPHLPPWKTPKKRDGILETAPPLSFKNRFSFGARSREAGV